MSWCLGHQRHTAQLQLFLETAESGEVYEIPRVTTELSSSCFSVPSRVLISSCLAVVQVFVGVGDDAACGGYVCSLQQISAELDRPL